MIISCTLWVVPWLHTTLAMCLISIGAHPPLFSSPVTLLSALYCQRRSEVVTLHSYDKWPKRGFKARILLLWEAEWWMAVIPRQYSLYASTSKPHPSTHPGCHMGTELPVAGDTPSGLPRHFLSGGLQVLQTSGSLKNLFLKFPAVSQYNNAIDRSHSPDQKMVIYG